MMYFIFFDESNSLNFGSAANVIDDFGQVELQGIREMYTAGEKGIILYDNSDPNWIAEKQFDREDEPPLLFKNMKECIEHAMGMILQKMYEEEYLLQTIFEHDIEAWTKLVRYI